MLDLPERALAHEIEKRMGGFLGPVALAGPRWSYKLGFHHAAQLTDLRLALIGDAAHGIHPIAGQGLNLGFRDAAALAEVLVEGARLGMDLGDAQLLGRYERWRGLDTLMVAFATDSLTRLYGVPGRTAAAVRRFGMGMVQRIGPLKDRFMAEARGDPATCRCRCAACRLLDLLGDAPRDRRAGGAADHEERSRPVAGDRPFALDLVAARLEDAMIVRRRPAEIVIEFDEAHRAALAAPLDHGVLDDPRRLEELARLLDLAGDHAADVADHGLERVGRIERRIVVDAAPLAGEVVFGLGGHSFRASSTSMTGTPARIGKARPAARDQLLRRRVVAQPGPRHRADQTVEPARVQGHCIVSGPSAPPGAMRWNCMNWTSRSARTARSRAPRAAPAWSRRRAARSGRCR